MDLKDFIAQSLKEIIQGIEEAQAGEGGDNVNAEHPKNDVGGNLMNAGDYGMFTRVDFDVAVSAETGGKGGGNLKVFGVGVEAGAEHKSGSANRLTFSIPLRIPSGDKELAAEVKKKRQEARERSAQKLRASRAASRF